MPFFFLVLTAFGLFVPAITVAAPLGGKYNRAQLEAICAREGGSYWSNLDAYGCYKRCRKSNGEPAWCNVYCENDGSCSGSTPGRLAAGVGIKEVLAGSGALDPGPSAPSGANPVPWLRVPSNSTGRQ